MPGIAVDRCHNEGAGGWQGTELEYIAAGLRQEAEALRLAWARKRIYTNSAH